MDADSLAKRLYQHIPERIPAKTRREYGCLDFLQRGDYPDTRNPVNMAYAWFCSVALDKNGAYKECGWTVESFLAFLKEQTGRTPTLSDLGDLRSILLASPVGVGKLQTWFGRVYPQERGRFS